jgi:hypothetical protein
MNGARFVSGFTNCQAKRSNIASFYADSADLPNISGALVGVYGGGAALAGIKTKGATFQPPLCTAQQPECGALLISGQRCSQQRLASLRQKAAC